MRTLIAALALATLAPAMAQAQAQAQAQGGTAYIPKAVELPGLTPAEATANAIWSLRGALNVAALQCQFSPYLRIVGRYNAMIHQHSRELERARLVLGKYFLRVSGRGGANAFDHYNTVMFQSYSTLDAQFDFCDRAGIVGRDAVVQPIGQLGMIAVDEVTRLRASLSPQYDAPVALAALDPLIAAVPLDEATGRRRR